ncbi:titin homolog [Helianthus annuus]|uniref:titin homolog n=1 Tax=Helianthus annuus TaxID=4232 RepID=UPI000B8F36E2|nr:titin homolog [Helianthus annuus]
MRKPKPEPRDAADIPPSNPEDPIDLESSPEHLLRKKAGKRKQTDVEAEGQPAKKVQKKKITRKGNLDAFIAKPVLEKPSAPVFAEPSSVVNEELPPSPPHALVNEQLGSTETADNEAKKTDGAENPEAEKPADVAVDAGKITSPEAVDVSADHPQTPEFVAQDPEKGKSAQEIPITTSPSAASGFMPENNEKVSAEDQGWKRKAEAEAALLSKEHKNWKEICEKNNAEKMGLRNVINNLKAEVEKLKKQDAEIEKLEKEKAEAKAARDEVRSHRERNEQREVHTCATLALRDKEIEDLIALLSEQEQLKAEVEAAKKDLNLERTKQVETSRRLTEIEDKLENSETARATAESELEPLKSDMLWLKEHGTASVAESVLNSEELDKTVAHLLVASQNDGYAQGYAECSHHVVNALKVEWDTSKSAPMSEDRVAQLKEIFPDREEDEDEDLA